MNDQKRSWARVLASTVGIFACCVGILGSIRPALAQESTRLTTEGLGVGPQWMEAKLGATRTLAYPPLSGKVDAPRVVMLHGMCDAPENECPWFAGAVSKDNWLLCPKAPLGCAGGGSMWPGATATRISSINNILTSFETSYPSTTRDPSNKILVGFSQGAYMAADIAVQPGASWKGLILIGAKVNLDPRRLSGNGIKRVVLASGDYDGARDEMRRVATRTNGVQGLRVRYESLGRVGHGFAADMDGWMAGALAWVESEGD